MAITTVSDIIREHGVDRADHTALIEGDRRLSWRQLLDRSCRLANLLAAAGVADVESRLADTLNVALARGGTPDVGIWMGPSADVNTPLTSAA